MAGLRGDQALLATGGPSQRDRQGKGARGTAAAPLLPTPACSGAEPAARLLAMGMAQHHGVGRHLSVCACVPRDAQLETALSPKGPHLVIGLDLVEILQAEVRRAVAPGGLLHNHSLGGRKGQVL